MGLVWWQRDPHPDWDRDQDPDRDGGGGGDEDQDPERNPIDCAARPLWEGLKGCCSSCGRIRPAEHSQCSPGWSPGSPASCLGAPAMGVGGVGAPQRTRDSSLDCWHFLGHFPAAGHPELCGFLLPPAGEKTRGDTQHWDQTRGDGWGHTPPPR